MMSLDLERECIFYSVFQYAVLNNRYWKFKLRLAVVASYENLADGGITSEE